MNKEPVVINTLHDDLIIAEGPRGHKTELIVIDEHIDYRAIAEAFGSSTKTIEGNTGQLIVGVDPASPDGDYSSMVTGSVDNAGVITIDNMSGIVGWVDDPAVDLKTKVTHTINNRMNDYGMLAAFSAFESMYPTRYNPSDYYYKAPPTKAAVAERAKVLKKRAINKANRRKGR